jgi:hypothetical protein
MSLRKKPTLSAKRVAASRANGSRSRGPVTAEGAATVAGGPLGSPSMPNATWKGTTVTGVILAVAFAAWQTASWLGEGLETPWHASCGG